MSSGRAFLNRLGISESRVSDTTANYLIVNPLEGEWGYRVYINKEYYNQHSSRMRLFLAYISAAARKKGAKTSFQRDHLLIHNRR